MPKAESTLPVIVEDVDNDVDGKRLAIKLAAMAAVTAASIAAVHFVTKKIEEAKS